MNGDALEVSAELVDAIVQSEREFCETIRHADPSKVVGEFVAGQHDLLTMLEPFLGRFQTPSILEIGSGNGFGLCYLLKSGFNAVGVEPGRESSFEGRWDRAAALLRSNGITAIERVLHRAQGEALPFPDDQFDIVISVAVLEHVRGVEQCVREAVRVLKRGGVLILNVPNYNSFWEGHYDCLWLPYVLSSKRVAKWYVRNIIRRSPHYIDELNFVTPRTFTRMANELPDGDTLTIHPFCTQPFARFAAAVYYLAVGYPAKHHLLALLDRLRLARFFVIVGRPIVRFLSILGFSPTLNVIYTKP